MCETTEQYLIHVSVVAPELLLQRVLSHTDAIK